MDSRTVTHCVNAGADLGLEINSLIEQHYVLFQGLTDPADIRLQLARFAASVAAAASLTALKVLEFDAANSPKITGS